jgi:hypothetical protein
MPFASLFPMEHILLIYFLLTAIFFLILMIFILNANKTKVIRSHYQDLIDLKMGLAVIEARLEERQKVQITPTLIENTTPAKKRGRPKKVDK